MRLVDWSVEKLMHSTIWPTLGDGIMIIPRKVSLKGKSSFIYSIKMLLEMTDFTPGIFRLAGQSVDNELHTVNISIVLQRISIPLFWSIFRLTEYILDHKPVVTYRFTVLLNLTEQSVSESEATIPEE